MELDDMKNMWQQHDKLLQQNKILSEKLINGMLKEKSKGAIGKMMGYEYFGLCLCLMLALFFILRVSTMAVNLSIGASYAVVLVFIIVAILASVYKIKLLGSIDPGITTVSDTAMKIERFRMFMVRERLLGLLTFPLPLITAYAVVLYWTNGIIIYDHFANYYRNLIPGTIAAYFAVLALYRYMYFGNIKEIKDNLKEIEEFKAGM